MEVCRRRQETGLSYHKRLTKKMRVFVQWKVRRRLMKEVEERNRSFTKSVELGCFGVARELD
jgi:hypothetical protein